MFVEDSKYGMARSVCDASIAMGSSRDEKTEDIDFVKWYADRT